MRSLEIRCQNYTDKDVCISFGKAYFFLIAYITKSRKLNASMAFRTNNYFYLRTINCSPVQMTYAMAFNLASYIALVKTNKWNKTKNYSEKKHFKSNIRAYNSRLTLRNTNYILSWSFSSNQLMIMISPKIHKDYCW